MIAELTTAADVAIKALDVLQGLFVMACIVAVLAVLNDYHFRGCNCQHEEEEE
jgi:hypothetical protein